MRRKKGAISMHFLVGMIILVLSVVVILFFYWQFYWKGQITKEVCHQSVLLRDTFNIGQTLELGRETIPLRCQTQKICLYLKEKDECGFASKKDIEYVKVEDENDIKRELANAMYDAWNTMGEGRLQIFHRGKSLGEIWDDVWHGKTYTHRCVIFSRIGFSEDLKKEFKGKTINLEEYLNKKISGKEVSYWNYFAGALLAEGNLEIFDMRKYEKHTKFLSSIPVSDNLMIFFIELNRRSLNLPFTDIKFLVLQDLVDYVDWAHGASERHFISGIFLRRDISVLSKEDIEKLDEVCGEFHELV